MQNLNMILSLINFSTANKFNIYTICDKGGSEYDSVVNWSTANKCNIYTICDKDSTTTTEQSLMKLEALRAKEAIFHGPSLACHHEDNVQLLPIKRG